MTRTAVPSMAFFNPKAISAILPSMPPPKDMVTTTLFVTNAHCSSCVTHIKDTVGPLPGIYDVQVNLVGHTICVQHEPGLTSKIADVLLDAAFEVRHVTTSNSSGRVIGTHDVSNRLEKFKYNSITTFFTTKAQKKHLANCEACRSDSQHKGWLFRSSSTVKRQKTSNENGSLARLEEGTISPTVKAHDEKPPLSPSTPPKTAVYVATISIEGMTCASCSSSITNELGQIDYIQDVQVNLLANNAKITYRGEKSDAQKVAKAIEDVGFDASVDDVVSLQAETDHDTPSKAVISIEGMTCGSCVAAVSEGLKQVTGITSVNVDLLGNCATVQFTNETSIDKIVEAVEDLGFDASLGQLMNGGDPAKERETRTVEFEITGMYCPMCPSKILDKIKETFTDSVRIVSEPTLKRPHLVVDYEPAPPDLTIRKLNYAIESADPVIIASIYHPPSIEERSIAVQRKESGRILRHLLFTLVAAIPSFVIGIVYMNLVPQSNPTRLWLEERMWAGNVMRMDWAMFFITTPVMFYGAGIFHIRALKEIWSLWRPKSKVPILRRFYRFGSMNLLISAGASVAYFSSLAILIMEAVSRPDNVSSQTGTMPRRSITYFDTVTFLTLFLLCGKFLQAYSKSRTGDAVAMLGKLRPSEALLVDTYLRSWEEDTKSQIRSIPIDLLEVGDTVSIPHGSSPPTDGAVDQDGTFLFDESSLTGESKPVRKVRGDTILTGSVNVSDPVRIVVRELGGKSMLDRIIAVVREGQAKRAPVERFADLITSYFTPVITLIAITTWIVWLVLGQSGVLPQSWLDVDQGGWPFWSVEFAIAVFVVACPCGLGLAAPTALFVGGGLAAKVGILVQGGGEAFQEASQLDAIVFDKTGTLTEGQMRVTDVEILDQQDQKEKFDLTLHLAKALEDSSTHPIARAIAKFCDESKSPKAQISISDVGIKEIPGQGMTGIFDVLVSGAEKPTRYEAAIGNDRLLQTLDITTSGLDSQSPVMPGSGRGGSSNNAYLFESLGRFQAAGCSTAIFAFRKISSSTATSTSLFTPLTVFAITDPIRPEALNVLRTLRDQNVSVHMCTGDNAVTARAIASQLDIPVSNVRAGVLPQDKATYIKELQSLPKESKGAARRIVAFVGDGTNDTPALTAADVSIALSSGSDVAMTSASFILLNSDLGTILHLVRLAKRVFLRVKLNFAWAAMYNVCLIPVAAGVFFPIAQWRLSPVWAAAAMAGSSVSVVLSSLALKLPAFRLGGKRSRN